MSDEPWFVRACTCVILATVTTPNGNLAYVWGGPCLLHEG